MVRHFWSIGLILALAAAARADSIGLTVTGLPTSYTPGSTLTFEVGLTGATGLNSYDIALDLTSNTGKAGNDFYFVGSPATAQAPAASYVFSSNLGVSSPFGFQATASTMATNTATLDLSDFLAAGQSVSDSGSYTTVATVVVQSTAAAGNLTLSFDGPLLELDNSSGTSVAGFSALEENIASFDPAPVPASVPAPSNFTALCSLLLVGIVSLALRASMAVGKTAHFRPRTV